MNIAEIFQINESARLVVRFDTDAECPRGNWHTMTGFVKIPNRGDSRLVDVPAVHDDPIGIAEAHERFSSLSEELTARWTRIFHGLHIEYDAEHGGYWFVAGADADTAKTPVDTHSRALFYDNWPELAVGSPEHLAKQAKVIEQEREVYRQWAEGEVYGVVLERAQIMAPVEFNEGAGVYDLRTPLTEDDLTLEWGEEDSIWGSYLDNEYTAQQVALEYFDLTDKERAAPIFATIFAEHGVA